MLTVVSDAADRDGSGGEAHLGPQARRKPAPKGPTVAAQMDAAYTSALEDSAGSPATLELDWGAAVVELPNIRVMSEKSGRRAQQVA